jgi:hypothetical protein
MDMKEAGRAVRPLRFIFWGGVLGILVLPRWLMFVHIPWFSLRPAHRVLFLVSAVGAAPLSFGSFWLTRIDVSKRYRIAMSFAGAVFALRAAASLFVGAFMPDAYLDWAIEILHMCHVVWLAAAVVLCLGMRWFTEEADLTAAFLEWRVTMRLALATLVVVAAANVFSNAGSGRTSRQLYSRGSSACIFFFRHI